MLAIVVLQVGVHGHMITPKPTSQNASQLRL